MGKIQNLHPNSLHQIATLKQVGQCHLNLMYNGMYCLGLQWNDEADSKYFVRTSQSLIRLFLQKKVNLLEVISAPDSTYFSLTNEEYEAIRIGQNQEAIPGLVASSVQLSNVKTDALERLFHFFNGELRLRLMEKLRKEYLAYPGPRIVRNGFEPLHEFKKEELLKMLLLSDELKKINNILRIGYTRVDFTAEDLVSDLLENMQPNFETYGDLFVFVLDMMIQMITPPEKSFVNAIKSNPRDWLLPFSAN